MSETIQRLRPGVDLPGEMIGRPIDHRGFPVPWFVTEKDEHGNWDFVRIEARRFNEAIRGQFCWVSGKPLGRYRTFVIGPMCVVNRVAADPPVKKSIGEWSAKTCPFMLNPAARRDRSIPKEAYEDQRGVMLERNPGVCALYTVKGHVRSRNGLFHLPAPESVEWFAKGQRASRDQVVAAIQTGLPTLEEMAAQEGQRAIDALAAAVATAMQFLPSDTAPARSHHD